MMDSKSEEGDYKRYAITLVPTPLRYDWYTKERASIDTESLSEESLSETEYPRPSRLFQCALVFAGFFATFQTIGLNQTYGIFQASLLAMSLPRISPESYMRMVFRTGFLYIIREQHP